MKNIISLKCLKWFGAMLIVGAGFILASRLPVNASFQKLRLESQAPPAPLPADSPALALQNAFIRVAQAVGPAVVNISSEWTEDVHLFNDFGNMDDFFNFFFNGSHDRPFHRQAPQMKQKQRALGSGFLISSDGYILTNAHVIGKAEKVTVTFKDGSSYPAKIVGKDTAVDIGILKIEDGKKTFPHVVLGDSNAIEVGQWAIAIGDPFALDHTLTTGVISAKGRNVEVDGASGYQNYIQTDASINPGNSGGPLCDIEGRVIGINSAIYSQSGGSVGIGFAIPSNIARKAAEDLVNYGKVTHAGIGAVVQSLSSPIAKSFGLSTTEGALISSVKPDGAAQKAGLKSGDIVLSVDGDKVTDSGDLVSKLFTHKPGDKVVLTILRSGEQMKVPVTLQKLNERDLRLGEEPNGKDSKESLGENQDLGLTFQDQTPDLKGQLDKNAPKGPVVTGVDQEGPAAAAGLKEGDIILKVGKINIVSANQLSVVLKKSDLNNGVRLFVWRDGVTLYLFLQKGN